MYFSWVRAAAMAGGIGLLSSAEAWAQATGPCSLAGTADLAQVQNLPAAADLVVAGYAPTAADPYQHLPAWKAAFAYAGQASLPYRAANLPAGRFVVFSFLDANRNGLFEATEKLARVPGVLTLTGNTTGATVNYPEDCSFYTAGWKALDYFTQNPRPNFNPATTLPYLTKFSWGESDAIALELGANWRYAVDVSTFMGVEFPGNRPLAAAVAAQPGRYKVQNAVTLGNAYRDAPLMARFRSAYLWDSVTSTRSNAISPVAPDSIFKALGQRWADDFAAIRAVYPGLKYDYLLNGGESGLELSTSGVGESGPGPWQRDPAVVRDKRRSVAQLGTDAMWYRYSSDKKARHEAWLGGTAKAGFAAVQGFAPTITYYGAGYNPAMGRWWGCHWYDFAYDAFRQYNAVDYSSVEFYYGSRGGRFSGFTADQPNDFMTQAMNTYAGEIQYQQKITKPYLSCGWISEDNNSVSAPDRWMGFLKFEALCGGVAPTVSNFDQWQETKPQRLDGAVVAANDPHMQWIWQYFVSSHAHAAFTHLQDYITGGALVADPVNNHPFSRDPYYPAPRPWYMFCPTGEYSPTEGFRAVVLARKLSSQEKYLVLAWASSGTDRLVNVAVPGLGTLALYARTAGTIYQIEGTGAARTIEVLDPGAMNPAACLGPTPGVSSPLATTAPAPADMALQAFPNPAAGTTMLRYYLARAGAVQLAVHDVLGRSVAWPVNGFRAAGWHEAPLALPAAPNGLYQAVLTGPAGRQTVKILFQR